MENYTIHSSRVLLPSTKEPIEAVLTLSPSTGKFVSITRGPPSADTSIDIELHHALVFPGLVDAHVHVNDPGRTEWEEWGRATEAAAAGGVTTIVDMPLNSIPPTTTVANFNTKLEAAKKSINVDVAFWGGIIPTNAEDLKPLIEKGVKGFKCFLCPSGVDEFPCVNESEVLRAMKELDGTDIPFLFHAELEHDASSHQLEGAADDPTVYDSFLKTRPDDMEYRAIELVIKCLRQYPRVRAHIVHLSSASCIPLLQLAQAEGLRITVETCFHYLCLSADTIPDSQTLYKCCPPIRTHANREALWSSLLSPTGDSPISMVVSDHSPSTSSLKHPSFLSAWGGISSLGLGLPLLLTELSDRAGSRRYELARKWLAEEPARHAGLQGRKGRIEVGMDADLCVVREEEWVIGREQLRFKNAHSPYASEGRKVDAKVVRTFLRGVEVYREGEGLMVQGAGKTLL
ncbi:allantoinase [Atractiella rhizophila]|nr:allantoinase [Atractiella rhizophila]